MEVRVDFSSVAIDPETVDKELVTAVVINDVVQISVFDEEAVASPRMHKIFTEGYLDVRPFQHRSVRIVVPNDAVITNDAIAAKNRRQIEGDVALVAEESTEFTDSDTVGVGVHGKMLWMAAEDYLHPCVTCPAGSCVVGVLCSRRRLKFNRGEMGDRGVLRNPTGGGICVGAGPGD